MRTAMCPQEDSLSERCFAVTITKNHKPEGERGERRKKRAEVMENQGEDDTGEGVKDGNEEEEEVLGSSLTMEKVAAAKQFIEGHYKAHMKLIAERKKRSLSFPFYSMIQFAPLIFFQNFESFHWWWG